VNQLGELAPRLLISLYHGGKLMSKIFILSFAAIVVTAILIKLTISIVKDFKSKED